RAPKSGRACDRIGVFAMTFKSAILAALFSLIACAATAQEVAEFSPRVRALLEQMTLEEKLTMVQGSRDPAYNGGAGYIAGVPRPHVPPLRLAHGPAKVYVRYETTAPAHAI